MAKSTLEELKDIYYNLTASQINFLLTVGESLQSGRETVESFSSRLQAHQPTYVDPCLDYNKKAVLYRLHACHHSLQNILLLEDMSSLPPSIIVLQISF